jgi:hypothetical protein
MSSVVFFSLYFGPPLALLLAPLLLRNRWLLTTYVIVFGGGLIILHLWDQSIKSQPDYVDGAGGAALGEAMFLMCKISFVLGLGLRGAEVLWRYAVALRRTSAVRALLVVLLMFAAAFTLLSLLFVVVPNWQWRWLVGRWLIEFAEDVGGYFMLAWALVSGVLLGYPLLTRSRETRGSA